MDVETLYFADIKEGDSASFSIRITDALVDEFTKVSGNYNPLHADAHYQGPPYKERIAHGMLAGALLSRLIGMQLPGFYSLCLSQTLSFREPMRIGREVTVSGVVASKSDAVHAIALRMKVSDKESGIVLVDSEAIVRVLK